MISKQLKTHKEHVSFSQVLNSVVSVTHLIDRITIYTDVDDRYLNSKEIINFVHRYHQVDKEIASTWMLRDG